MSKLNAFQLELLNKVLDAPESASQLKPASDQPGYFYLTHDKWKSFERISRAGDERSYYLIQDLVEAGLLRMGAVRQPVPGGFERREFYFVTPLARQELAAIAMEQRSRVLA